MKKPYASDWKVINYAGVQYSAHLELYWVNNTVYDERSAQHNGIVGAGAMLRKIVEETTCSESLE